MEQRAIDILNSQARQSAEVVTDYKRLRYEALYRYGGMDGCACCGIRRVAVLAVDHIDGGGAAERKAAGGSLALLRKLRREGWPDGYQVLCHNCNWSKGTGERCDCRDVFNDVPLDELLRLNGVLLPIPRPAATDPPSGCMGALNKCSV